jgi:ectoine hydroxylase-related dioxygenase (phytanoyl-CoA dioxygenase family)
MNLDNGCFKILPNSFNITKKKRKINPRMNVFKKGHKLYSGLEINKDQLVPIIANSGDLIIFDTNCIHCGGDDYKNGKDRKVIRLHIKKI